MKVNRTAAALGAMRCKVASPDGTICFDVARCKGGIHVERTELCPELTRVTRFCFLFSCAREFETFCDHDELRFKHPLTYQEAKRQANALLETAWRETFAA